MSLDVRRRRPSHSPQARGNANAVSLVRDTLGRAQSADFPSSYGYAPWELNQGQSNDQKAVRRHRHAAPTRSQELVTEHGTRLSRFSVIGGGIFVAGLALQAVLTGGLHMASFLSYLVQAVVSVEASFLLNRWYTWHRRGTEFWPALLRFNMQKTVTIAANLVLYAGLLKLGINYLLANVVLTVVFTLVNYVAGDRFVFTPDQAGTETEAPSVFGVQTIPFRAIPAAKSPTVSVVVPCKGNEETIRATVDSLMAQNYPGLREIILVGSPSDSTWQALAGVRDRRLVVLETETPPGIRDANFKRDLGIRETTSDLVSLVDSDMVLPDTWLSRAVTAIMSTGADCVAGVMRSYHDDFWGRYVDNCRLGAKTPRVKDSYFVTAKDFGSGAQKPPITANILFTRAAYERCPIDSSWSHGSLEDYEWFWRIVESGQRVLVTDRLFGWHHHRAGLARLAAEYRRSARGCAYFIRAHSESPFARKRLMQAVALPLAAVAALAGVATGIAAGYEIQTAALAAALGLLAATVLCGREFAHTRTLESLTYPLPALVLGASYTASLITHLVKRASVTAVATSDAEFYRPSACPAPGIRRFAKRRALHPLNAILAVQTGLSLSLVWSNTAFGDEANYLWGGHLEISNWLHHTPVPAVIGATYSGSPIIYPPLGAMADSIGGLTGARLLSLFFMLGATGFLYLVTVKLFDRTVALIAASIWVVTEPVIRLGAFATYDAMAILLTSFAAWLAIQAAHRQHRGELVAASGLVLALADTTAYSEVSISLVMMAFTLLAWWPRMGLKHASHCAAWLGGSWLAAFCLLLTISHSWAGITFTVFSRGVNDRQSLLYILDHFWLYSGLLLVLAAVGVITSFATSDAVARKLLVTLLCFTVLVVPAAQIKVQTAWSFDKHIAYGAWFAAMAAAYGCRKLAGFARDNLGAVPAIGCAAILLVFPAITNLQTASNLFHSWPNASSFIAALKSIPALEGNQAIYVSNVGNANFDARYYTSQGHDWARWNSAGLPLVLSAASESKSIRYEDNELKKKNFGVIVLFYSTTIYAPSLPADMLLSPTGDDTARESLLNVVGENASQPGLSALTLALEADRSYRLMAVGPYDSESGGRPADNEFAIWQKVSH